MSYDDWKTTEPDPDAGEARYREWRTRCPVCGGEMVLIYDLSDENDEPAPGQDLRWHLEHEWVHTGCLNAPESGAEQNADTDREEESLRDA